MSEQRSGIESSQIVSLAAGQFLLTQSAFEAIVDLRWRVLRQGLPVEKAHFEGDRGLATRHFAAIAEPFEKSRIVCCASFMLNQWNNQPAWQLRGMATEPAQQRSGIGRELLRFAEKNVRRYSPIQLLWCNARVPARRFYERQGWRAASEEFVIPTAGPHVKMFKP